MPPIRALASSGSQTVSSASSMNKPPPSVDYKRVGPNEAAGSFRGVRTVRSSSWQGSMGGGSEAPLGRGRKSKLEAEQPGGHVLPQQSSQNSLGKVLPVTASECSGLHVYSYEELLTAVCPRSKPRVHV